MVAGNLTLLLAFIVLVSTVIGILLMIRAGSQGRANQRCSNCGLQNRMEADFCAECGQSLTRGMM